MASKRAWDTIPQTDGDFLLFAQAFASGIASSPSTYALSGPEAQTITQAVNEYVVAMAVASEKGTRTPGAINVKDTKRNAAKKLIRRVANQLRANMGISEAQLISVGIRRRPTSLGKRVCAPTSPVLNLQARTPGMDTLTYSDALSMDSAAKPYGAERLELFAVYTRPGERETRFIGGPPADVRYLGSFRRNPIAVEYDPDRGEPTYWARWAGFNDDVGPWSLPCSFSMAAKKVKEAAGDDANVEVASKAKPDDDQSLKLAA